MKVFRKMILLALSLTMCMTSVAMAGCRGKNDDIIVDEEGNVKPGGKAAQVEFWGWGTQTEEDLFNDLTKSFNQLYDGVAKVKYVHLPSSGYSDAVATQLMGNRPPDIVYAGDANFKSLAESNLIMDLTERFEESTVLDEGDMWERGIGRFRYDTTTTTQLNPEGEPAQLWGVPKDIGNTVLYYNETQFQQAGVRIISVPESEIASYSDANGSGYGFYGYHDYGDGKGKVFNNRIPMNWEETITLSRLLQQNTSADYGYYTEWWFAYGWSVGGDVIQYVPTEDNNFNGGYWDFTHADATKNYRVAPGKTFVHPNGKTYNEGEIIVWNEKFVDPKAQTKVIHSEILTAKTDGILWELPSQREAFTEFTRLSHTTGTVTDTVPAELRNDFYGVSAAAGNLSTGQLNGYQITPNPNTISSDGKLGYFSHQKVSMLVEGRWSVVDLRRDVGNRFTWNVAPLPIYKEYNPDGTIKVSGVRSGHSGSMAMVISKKTQVPNAAWLFIEYIGGPVGQKLQSETGFAVPNQISLANSESFLQPDQMPKNSIVFVEAARDQKPGDWWMLKDSKWITEWADYLNNRVRNGQRTLTQFFDSSEYSRTFNLLKEYTAK